MGQGRCGAGRPAERRVEWVAAVARVAAASGAVPRQAPVRGKAEGEGAGRVPGAAVKERGVARVVAAEEEVVEPTAGYRPQPKLSVEHECVPPSLWPGTLPAARTVAGGGPHAIQDLHLGLHLLPIGADHAQDTGAEGVCAVGGG